MVRNDGAARAAPSRVAHVTRGTLGDREVSLSQYDATAVGAFRHCREGATRPTWSAARKAWFVPASTYGCVRRLLIDAGFEISETQPKPSAALARFSAARDRVQRSRDNARWIAGVEDMQDRGES